jgi:N-acetylmuramoyl-L-alanine amidase
MRTIRQIIIHFSETPEGKDFGAKDIDLWHKQKGWRGIGYHYVIKLDGTIEDGRPLEQIGSHCYGQNRDSIGICYIGGKRDAYLCDTRTNDQKDALLKLIKELKDMFPENDLLVFGHNDYSNKVCPGFDAKAEYN